MSLHCLGQILLSYSFYKLGLPYGGASEQLTKAAPAQPMIPFSFWLRLFTHFTAFTIGSFTLPPSFASALSS